MCFGVWWALHDSGHHVHGHGTHESSDKEGEVENDKEYNWHYMEHLL
jgi:hypothetical protein